MYLLKKQINTNKIITQIEFEKAADGLLMISVNYNADDQSRAFSYWRLLGVGATPPLEIGINTAQMTIKSLTFFIDSDCFKKVYLEGFNVLTGNIIVDTAIFKKENDYADTDGDYFVTLSNNKLTCIFDSHIHTKELIGNNCIKFFINNNDELCGFEIYNLNEHQINDLISIQ